jgi:hypothetical protein
MQRKYKVKDVEMLVTASTILESAIKNKDQLQAKRSSWKDPFFDDLKTKIDLAVQVYLGMDNAKELRRFTLTISNLKKEALRYLAEIKVQLVEDFKSQKARREEILKQLGFTGNLYKAQQGDQEGLIELLYQFKVNIAELQAEIIAKGTAKELIDNIVLCADKMKAADVNQELSKGTRKTITVEGVQEFNDIYNSIISISRIAAKFFIESEALKDQFIFGKVSKGLNAQKQKPKDSGEIPSA